MAQRRSNGCEHCGSGGKRSGGGKSSKTWKWIVAAVVIWYLVQSGALQTNGGIGGGHQAPRQEKGVCTQYFKGGC